MRRLAVLAITALSTFGLIACFPSGGGNPNPEYHCHVYEPGFRDMEWGDLSHEWFWQWHGQWTNHQYYCHSHPNFGEHWHAEHDAWCEAYIEGLENEWWTCVRWRYVR